MKKTDNGFRLHGKTVRFRYKPPTCVINVPALYVPVKKTRSPGRAWDSLIWVTLSYCACAVLGKDIPTDWYSFWDIAEQSIPYLEVPPNT